jgi:hypothetical protein
VKAKVKAEGEKCHRKEMLFIHRPCGTEPTEKRKTNKKMMVEIRRFKLLRLHFKGTSSNTCCIYPARAVYIQQALDIYRILLHSL